MKFRNLEILEISLLNIESLKLKDYGFSSMIRVPQFDG